MPRASTRRAIASSMSVGAFPRPGAGVSRATLLGLVAWDHYRIEEEASARMSGVGRLPREFRPVGGEARCMYNKKASLQSSEAIQVWLLE